MKRPLTVALCLDAGLALATAAAQQTESDKMTMYLTSSAFADGGAIPATHTCDGEDISPPLAWSGIPAGARSLVLIVEDPDAPDPQVT